MGAWSEYKKQQEQQRQTGKWTEYKQSGSYRKSAAAAAPATPAQVQPTRPAQQSPTLSRYKAQGGVTFEQYKAAEEQARAARGSLTEQRYRASIGEPETRETLKWGQLQQDEKKTPTIAATGAGRVQSAAADSVSPMGTLGRYIRGREKPQTIDYGDHGSDAGMLKWQQHWSEDLFQKYMAALPQTTEQIAKKGELLAGMQWGDEERTAAKELLKAAQSQNLTGNAYNPADYAPAWEAYLRGDEEEYARQVEIYDQLYARLHPKSTAFRSAAVEASGLGSMAKLGAAAVGDETQLRTLRSNEKTGAWAQAQEPGIAVATKAGVGAGMSLLVGGALTPAAGALGKTAIGATKLGRAAISAGQTALSFAARDALGNVGDVATGEMSGEEFGRRALASAAGGAAGQIASGLVSSGLAKVLVDKQMMTPFKEYLRQTAASVTFSAANTGTNALVSGRKMSANEVATELGMSFAFAMVSGYMSAMQSTKAASEQVGKKYDQITQEFEAIQNHMNGKQYATREEYEQALRDLRSHMQELKSEVGGTYYAGQQEFVDGIQKGLDVAIGNINLRLAEDTGAAAATSGASGMGAADVRLLTSEIESAIRDGASDTPNTPVAGGPSQSPAATALPEGEVRATAAPAAVPAGGATVPRPEWLPENMDVIDENDNGIPDNMEVIDEDGLPKNMVLDGNVATEQNGESPDPFRRSAPPPLGHQGEASESDGRTEASAPTGAGEAGEPEARTLLRGADAELDTADWNERSLLKNYKGRLAEYDEKRENLADQEKLLAQYEQTGDTQEAMKTRNRIQLLREQIAREGAYLEKHERTLRNVATRTGARGHTEKNIKELREATEAQAVSDKELRELEQSAQVQETAAEIQAQKAARAQDTAALEQRAKSHEYGAVLTSYYMSGFEASGMDVEQYDRAVRAAYEQGADGWRFRRTDAQRGIADEVLQAAYNEGRQKGADNGTAGTQDSGKRDAGMDPREPSGSVGKGTGEAAEGSAGGFGIKESLGIANRLQAAGAERVSSKADGIQNGTDAQAFRRVPDAMVQEYDTLRQAKQILTDAGADDVRFVSGTLEIKTESGKPLRVEGIAQDGTVWINIGAKNGVLKTAEHESMHLRMENEPGLRERLIAALGLSAEERDRLALKYCEAYEGCYGREDMSAYLDEIVCDAYAGINRAGLGADKLQNAVRAEADRVASQSTKKPAQTRGPPETYSVDAGYAEKLKEWAGDGMPSDASFTLGTTGDVLQGLGAIESDIYMDGGKIRTILAEHPEMTLHEIERIPEILDDPVMILKSKGTNARGNDNSRLVIFGSLKAQNENPILTVLDLRPKENGFLLDDMQKVNTAFTKKNPAAFVQASEVLYADRKRTAALLRQFGLTIASRELLRNGYIGSISYKGRSVNLRGEKFSDVVKLDDSGKTTAKLSPETQDAAASGSADGRTEASAPTETEDAGEQPKVYSYDKLPGKARQYVDAAVNRATGAAARAMSVPYNAQQRIVKPALKGLMEEFLKTGKIAQENVDKAFKKAYDEGLEVNDEFYRDYKFIRDKLRTTGVKVTPEVRAEFADLKQFQRAVQGKILLNNEGIGIDTLYGELHDEAPGLFPEAIMNPADQMMRMIEVANKIQITKQTLDEAHRGDGGDFRRWAKEDFERSVEDMTSVMRTVRRYVEAAERRQVMQYTPQSEEEALKLGEDLRKARKNYERVKNKNLLTVEDEKVVWRLLRGEIAPENVQGEENAKSILAVYQAKSDYDALRVPMERWKRGSRERDREFARKHLTNIEKTKDKKGFFAERETMTRNTRDVFTPEDAEAINRDYFAQVRKSEQKSTQYKNEMRDRVRALGLSTKETKEMRAAGRVSEAHAVQLYGEAMDNIQQLVKKPMDAKRDGKTLAEWEAVVRELWKTNPELDKAKIEGAVSEFRKIYDELLEKINAARIRNGYEPVPRRSGYFPHFQPGQTDGLFTLAAQALGIQGDVTALPTTIAGTTHTFKPGIKYFGNAQERLGFNTAYDAVAGFDKYIEGAADVIFQTDNIQRLRALSSEIRYMASPKGIREQVDAIRANSDLSQYEREHQEKDLLENGKYRLSGYVNELDEYTNLLAGKRSRKDRDMEASFGRAVYNVMKKQIGTVAANMVGLNPGSWLTNFAPLVQVGAQLGYPKVLKALEQTIASRTRSDGIFERSAFLTNRKGSDPLVLSGAEKISNATGWLMDWIDNTVAGAVVRARYYDNLRRGLNEEDAMDDADQYAADVMAARSKGEMPTRYESRNPVTKALTQFQLEVNNLPRNLFKDTTYYMRKDHPDYKKGQEAIAFAWVLLKYCIGAWMYNEVYERLTGRRTLPDPIDMGNNLVGDLTGKRLGNVLDAAVDQLLYGDGELIVNTAKKPLGTAMVNLGNSILDELPETQVLALVSSSFDGGKLPVTQAIPNVVNIANAITAEDLPDKVRWQRLGQEAIKPLTYLAPGLGGGQRKKIWQGIEAVARGGSFKYNNDGELVMQYPVFNQTTGQAVYNTVKASIFGKSATSEAKKWVENDFKSLSVGETNAYLAMSAADVKQREAWKLIKAMQAVDVPEGVSKKAAKLEALRDYDISDEAKALYYYNVIASDEERRQLDAYMKVDQGLADEKIQREINTAQATAASEEEQAAKEAQAERDRASKANYAQLYRKLRDVKQDGYETVYKSQLKALKEQEGLSDSEARQEIQKGIRAELKEAFKLGEVDEKTAKRILVNNLNETEGDTYWTLEEWKGGPDYSKYGKLKDAMAQGTDAKDAVQYYLNHGVMKRDISAQITGYFKPLYKAAETRQEKNEIARQANVFYRAAGYTDKWSDMMKWDIEK